MSSIDVVVAWSVCGAIYAILAGVAWLYLSVEPRVALPERIALAVLWPLLFALIMVFEIGDLISDWLDDRRGRDRISGCDDPNCDIHSRKG